MRPERIFLAEIPHPFDPEKKVIVGSESLLKVHYQKVFALLGSLKAPLLSYQVQSYAPDGKTRERVLSYERNLFEKWQKEYQSSLGRDILTLVFFVLLSYAIWNIGFIFKAVDALFMLAGDYLNPYARVVLILAPLIYVLYHKFLVGDTIFAKRRSFAFLRLIPWLEKSLKADFAKDLECFARKSRGPQREFLLSLLQALKNNDYDTLRNVPLEVQKLSLSLGEALRFASLCEELDYLLQSNFSPRIYHLEESQKFHEFFFSPAYLVLSEKVRQLFLDLPRSSSALWVALSDLEQITVRNLRGEVEEAYLEAILEYYRGLQSAFLSPSRENSPLTLEFPQKNRFLLSPLKTLLLSLLMIGISFFLFSMHLINDEDFLIVRSFVPGWQGIIGEQLTIVKKGLPVIEGKKLLFTIPRPFAFTHRATRQPQTVDALLILREVEPSPQGGILGTLRYLWDKGMSFFKEGYGNDFVVLRFSFTFQVEDPERWKQYDFDGRGIERLSRDIESYLLSYTDRVREKYRQAFFEEGYEQARAKLEEVSKSRTFREWVRRFLYPSPLDTYRVGSVYDMYILGLEWLRNHPHMENDPQWKEFVDHETKLIREKMQREHDDLIANPLRVRDMVRNPSVFAFSEYPGLYQTLLVMALNEIITGRFLEDLKDEKKQKEFQEESLEYLKKEGALFSNIGVALLSSRASLERVSYLYYLRLLQKRQNLL